MKIRINILVLLVAAVSQVAVAQSPDQSRSNKGSFWENTNLTITPTVIKTFGTTEWTWEATVPYDTTTFTLRSVLEYPLDVVMVGANIGLESGENVSRFWSFEVGFSTSINDPGKKMTDSDLDSLHGVQSVWFSITESDAEMSSYRFDAELAYQALDFGNLDLALVWGFGYHHIEQDMNGFEGHFVPWDTINQEYFDSTVAISMSTDTAVLLYEVTYKSMRTGILARWDLGESLQLNLKGTIGPVWVRDFDDHLLRKFNGTGKGTGVVRTASVKGRYDFGHKVLSLFPFVEIVGNLTNYSIDGFSDRYQYGDAGPFENPEGTRSYGIRHDVRSTQYAVGMRLGVGF